MSQSVIPFTAKLVKFDTDVPFAEVIFRLNIAVKKEGSENNTARIRSTNNQDELTTVVNEVIGDSQFLCVQFSIFIIFEPILLIHGQRKIFYGVQVRQVTTRSRGRR